MVAILSEGTTLNIGGAIGTVTSLSISHSRDTIDVSHLATTGGKDFLGAKLYEAELTAEMQFEQDDTAGQANILGDFAAAGLSASHSCVLTFSTGSFSFSGFVTSFDISGSNDSVVTASVTVKVSGDITQA